MNREISRVALALVVGASLLVTAGCARRCDPQCPPCTVDAGEGNRPYYTGTDAQRERVETLVSQLETTRGEAFLLLAQRIIAFGERAVPPLLEALAAPGERSRQHAAYILGVLKDRRTIPALAKVADEDLVPAVRYEAAGALLEMGDPRGLDVLVSGLCDLDARLRAKCIDVLAEKTTRRFGYEPDGSPPDREEAVRRWRAWLAQRREAGLEEGPAGAPAPVRETGK